MPIHAVGAEVDQFMAPGNCVGANQFCASSAKQFRDEFPIALRGKYAAQRNVAFCLLEGCDGAVKPNKTLGCAWRAVIVGSGSSEIDSGDVSNLNSCRGRLTGSEVFAFTSQYEALFKRIYGRTAPSVR